MQKGKAVRPPSAAGLFYPLGEKPLRQMVEACFNSPLGPGTLPAREVAQPRDIIGLISPHAGLIYSGPVAANGFSLLASQEKARRVVILGPNHHGLGPPFAVSMSTEWVMPMGRVKVDTEGVALLASRYKALKNDESAHAAEHSLEVQLPFLQYIYGKDLAIIPVSMQFLDAEVCLDFGRSIAAVFSPSDTLIIASSDFSHYESQEVVNRKDGLALRAIENMDIAGFASVVDRYDISACGAGPIIAMLGACLEWGASEAKVLRHATSGDVSGDFERVVGYASVAVSIKTQRS